MLRQSFTRVCRPRPFTLFAALGIGAGLSLAATAQAQHRGGGHSGGHTAPPVVHRPPALHPAPHHPAPHHPAPHQPVPHSHPHNPHAPVVVVPGKPHVGPVVRPTNVVVVVRPPSGRLITPVVVNPVSVTGDPVPVVVAQPVVSPEVAAAPVESSTETAGNSTALVITGLADRGPAALGGLRQGHVIVKAGGQRIKTGADLKAVAARGGRVEVIVYNTTSNQLETATVALAGGKFGVDYDEIPIQLDEDALADSKKGSG